MLCSNQVWLNVFWQKTQTSNQEVSGSVSAAALVDFIMVLYILCYGSLLFSSRPFFDLLQKIANAVVLHSSLCCVPTRTEISHFLLDYRPMFYRLGQCQGWPEWERKNIHLNSVWAFVHQNTAMESKNSSSQNAVRSLSFSCSWYIWVKCHGCFVRCDAFLWLITQSLGILFNNGHCHWSLTCTFCVFLSQHSLSEFCSITWGGKKYTYYFWEKTCWSWSWNNYID